MPRNRTGPQSGSSTAAGPAVVPLAPPRRERADAARNRLRVLTAAEQLFAERGVEGVTMDDIARTAGVGKGTLYRRFDDKGGLASALLSDRAVDLQQAMLGGPPPLGPGADPGDRLAAFAVAYLRFQARYLDLVLLSETSPPGSRLRKPSYGFWRQHCTLLLAESGAPDPLVRAEVLLDALAAEQVRHWVRVENRPLDGLADAIGRLCLLLAAPPGGQRPAR